MWIRLEVGLESHRKTRRLGRLLGVSDSRIVVGALFRLWVAIRIKAPDGNLRGWTPEDVAFEMGFPEDDADRIVAALLDCGRSSSHPDACGFLRREGDVLVAHDWFEHNGAHLLEAKRSRDRRRAQSPPDVAPPSTVRPEDVPPTSTVRPPDVHATGRDVTDVTERKDGASGAPDGELCLDPAVAQAVRQVRDSLRMPADPRQLDVKPIAEMTADLGRDLQRVAIQCAQKIFKAGAGQVVTEAIIADVKARAPTVRNWFAYTNPKTQAFQSMSLSVCGRLSEAEGKRFKDMERRLAASI